jgi:hypothetical protein
VNSRKEKQKFELKLMDGKLNNKQGWVYEANIRSTRRPTFFSGPAGDIRGLGQLCGD